MDTCGDAAESATYLSKTIQLIRLNSTTIKPPSAHAAIGALQMLLLINDRTVAPGVSICKLPEALARFVAVAHAMITYTASTSCTTAHRAVARMHSSKVRGRW
jgi:hypothetical protein